MKFFVAIRDSNDSGRTKVLKNSKRITRSSQCKVWSPGRIIVSRHDGYH